MIPQTWFSLPRPFTILTLLALFVGLIRPAHAQQTTHQPHIFITGHNSDTVPAVQLRLYGLDAAGRPIDFSAQPLTITHGDQTVTDVRVASQEEVGTLTIFLVDTPPGVASQIPAIQNAIKTYASSAHMKEGVDYVGIYQVGLRQASTLLPPVEFYNSVANAFATPIPIEAGATALIDSTKELLSNIESLKPQPGMAVSFVILSDGTDAVSTQAAADEVPRRADELGIPVHTVLLTNQDLGNPTAGAGFMQELAQATGGIATQMDNTEQLTAIWQTITSFRTQTIVQYIVPNLTTGQFPVTVSLQNDPAVQTSTTVDITGSRPVITLNIPADSRTLTLPSTETLNLQLPITVSWLDGQTRTITQAQLFVNGQLVQELDPAALTSAPVTIPNLVFGENRLQIAAVDDAVQRALSAEVVLTVVEGETNIPAALQGGSTAGSSGWQTIIGCVFALFALVAFVFLLSVLRDLPLVKQLGLDQWLNKLPWPQPRPRRTSQVTITDPTPAGEQPTTLQPIANYYLDVLESVTRINSPLPISGIEIRLGRSSAQSDIAFVDDITVSRLHATLLQEGEGYRLFDEKSTSGTQVNGQPLPEYGVLLMNGDEILLGAVRLRFRRA